MKTFLISCALLLVASMTFGQSASDTIVVAPGSSGLYFYHIVQKGESLTSLSRQYGLQQDVLSRLNNTQRLQPYEMIKIPLAPSQIVQDGTALDHQGLRPLYHKVLKGETLFRVGKLYGDIPLDRLRQWNNLSDSNVGVGQYLIVGWLKKASAQSPVAQAAPTRAASPAASDETLHPSEPQSEAQSTSPATETAATAEGHSFLQEVIASEKHRARHKGSLATETAVSRPLLSGAPESPGPAVSNSSSDPAVSRPLLPAPPPASENNSNQPVVQQNPPLKETSTPPPVAATSPAPKTQQSGTVPAQVPTTAPPDNETSSPSKDSGENEKQEAKDANPFEKMLNQITGKKEKSSPAAAEADAASDTPEQKTPSSTPLQPVNATERLSDQTSEVLNQVTTSAPMAAIPATSNRPSATPAPAAGSSNAPSADDPTSLSAGEGEEDADSATLQLAQKSEFQELYLAQTQDEKLVTSKKGAAGWFKSNVKPGAKTYYALCNDLPRGTIVKVINPINKRFVFVKVLASIPEQKENYNLIIKLSDAAMDDLGTHQPRFWSEIVYPRLKD